MTAPAQPSACASLRHPAPRGVARLPGRQHFVALLSLLAGNTVSIFKALNGWQWASRETGCVHRWRTTGGGAAAGGHVMAINKPRQAPI